VHTEGIFEESLPYQLSLSVPVIEINKKLGCFILKKKYLIPSSNMYKFFCCDICWQ
jgi:hypothetical protein